MLGWAGTLVLVRVLSPEDWGAYSLIFNIMGLVGSFADLKLGRVVLQEIQEAGERTGEVLGSYVTLRLIVGVVCYGIALAVVVVGRYPAFVVEAMALAAVVLVVAAIETAIYVYFTSQMWMRSLAGASVLAQLVQFGTTVLLAATGYSRLILFMLPAILFEFVVLGWQTRVMRGFVRLRLDRSRWSAWLKDAVFLSIGSTLGSIYGEIDSVLLSKLSSITAVGVYAVGQKFATFTLVLSEAVSISLFVTMGKCWPKDREGFAVAFRQAFLVLFVAAVAVVIEFSAFAPQVIELLYGHTYRSGARAAVFLVASEALAFFSELCIVTLTVIGRNLPYLIAAAVGVVVNVALNVVLIPQHSYNGASVAILVTQAVVLVMLAVVVRRHGRGAGWIPLGPLVKAAGAGCVLAALAFGLRGRIPWEAAAAVAGLGYLLVLHVTRPAGPGGLRDLVR